MCNSTGDFIFVTNIAKKGLNRFPFLLVMNPLQLQKFLSFVKAGKKLFCMRWRSLPFSI